jgi:predicted DNA-binding protein (UPF0251 family)
MKMNTQLVQRELDRINQDYSWLARRMGVSRQAVWEIMNKGGKTLKIIDRFAVALRLNPRDLIIF